MGRNGHSRRRTSSPSSSLDERTPLLHSPYRHSNTQQPQPQSQSQSPSQPPKNQRNHKRPLSHRRILPIFSLEISSSIASQVAPAFFNQKVLQSLFDLYKTPSPRNQSSQTKPQPSSFFAFGHLHPSSTTHFHTLQQNIQRPASLILAYTSIKGIEYAKSLPDLLDNRNFLQERLSEGTVWIDLFRPSRSDFSSLCKAFDIHPLVVEATYQSSSVETINRCEFNGKYLILTARVPHQVSSYAIVTFLIFPTCVPTISANADTANS